MGFRKLNQKNNILYLIFMVFLIGVVLNGCTYKKFGEDQDLYALAKNTDGFTWFKNTDSLLARSNGSGHTQSHFKTRFNAIAASNLDSNFKIKTNSPFSENSVIVKELIENGTFERYAVLYKKSDHPNADAKGWVWGYINKNGSVQIASSKKGANCSGCHSQAGNDDYTLMNKFFP